MSTVRFQPQDQSVIAAEGERGGDCLMACVASIAGVPLAELPVLTDAHDDGSWWTVLLAALHERALTCVFANNDPPFMPCGYHIASGPSPRGPWGHAVVARDGEIVHDPHPSRSGIERIERWILIYPLVALTTAPRGAEETNETQQGSTADRDRRSPAG